MAVPIGTAILMPSMSGWRGMMLQLSIYYTPMPEESKSEQGYGSAKKLYLYPYAGGSKSEQGYGSSKKLYLYPYARGKQVGAGVW